MNKHMFWYVKAMIQPPYRIIFHNGAWHVANDVAVSSYKLTFVGNSKQRRQQRRALLRRFKKACEQ